ncbi:kinase C-binding 1, partial [Schistosoma japonicum]
KPFDFGQTKTWQKSMKSLTSGLSHVGRCRLRGWGPRDESHQWLDTLNDMAQNRSQWR